MRRSWLLVPAFAVAATLPAVAEEGAAKVRPYAIGDVVADFTLKGLDGKTFRLSAARSIPSEQATAAVREAAKTAGAADPKPEEAIDALPSLQEGGAVDATKRHEWVRSLGREWGLLPSAETVAGLKTLGDAARWLENASTAPIVLMCWKKGCPTTAIYADRLNELLEKTGARLYVLATNSEESDAEIETLLKEKRLPWRVLDDRKLEVTERLGGRKTPHVFLLDKGNALRYAGAIDDDPAQNKKPEERARWLEEAVARVAKGFLPKVLLTEPDG